MTACLAFSTIHPQALDALFSAALARDMTVISGKTMMDCNAPKPTVRHAANRIRPVESADRKMAGQGAAGYAITPRFAVTSAKATRRCRRTTPGVSRPTDADTSVREHRRDRRGRPRFSRGHGLHRRLRPRRPAWRAVLFAHGIHLSERELARHSEAGATVVHCPTSNNFLGSGLFRYHHTRDSTRRSGSASAAISAVARRFRCSRQCATPISCRNWPAPHHRFRRLLLATLGNARLLRLDDEIGSPGPAAWPTLSCSIRRQRRAMASVTKLTKACTTAVPVADHGRRSRRGRNMGEGQAGEGANAGTVYLIRYRSHAVRLLPISN